MMVFICDFDKKMLLFEVIITQCNSLCLDHEIHDDELTYSVYLVQVNVGYIVCSLHQVLHLIALICIFLLSISFLFQFK